MVMTRGRHSVPSRTETPDPRDAARRPAGKAYRPGLDGLRALAVIGVLLYHAGVRWMPGGLLGVDLFFVISGFLITSLLIAELERSGRIALAGFYGRRARRLFPALAAVLALAVGAMALFRPGDLVRFRGDLLASVGYVANWWFIVKHQSYFVASGRPSPFQHLWSLAVEEQFYILWPLGLLALWRSLTRGRGLTEARALAPVGWYAAGAACLSASLMAYIATREGLPERPDSSRVYFVTDTHASGPLLAVAAAAFLATLPGPLCQRPRGGELPVGGAAHPQSQVARLLAAATWARCFAGNRPLPCEEHRHRAGQRDVAASCCDLDHGGRRRTRLRRSPLTRLRCLPDRGPTRTWEVPDGDLIELAQHPGCTHGGQPARAGVIEPDHRDGEPNRHPPGPQRIA